MYKRNAPVEERFLHYVNKTDACWFWTAAKDRAGYGITNVKRRVVESRTEYCDGSPKLSSVALRETAALGHRNGVQRIATTTGFTDCKHDAYRPGVVLDPFAGTGTVGAVATGHGRDAILIDLDSRNLDLARERIGFLLDERA